MDTHVPAPLICPGGTRIPAMVRRPSTGTSSESAGARLDALLARAQAALNLPLEPATQQDVRHEQRTAAAQLLGELRLVAARTGAGLALYRDAVLLCARLLQAGGDLIKAAGLLADAGLSQLAARLAEQAGDVELLEAQLLHVHAPEVATHAAQLHFGAYEAALARGQLGDALAAIKAAAAARPDNPAYLDLATRLEARRPVGPGLGLETNGRSVTLALAPAWLGRGDGAALRVQGVGVSRQHARVELNGGVARLINGRGDVLWQDAVSNPNAPQLLTVGQLPVKVGVAGGGVELDLEEAGLRALVMQVDVPALAAALGLPGNSCSLRWPEQGFPRLAIPGVQWRVDGAVAVPMGQDLGVGQQLEIAGAVWTVRA